MSNPSKSYFDNTTEKSRKKYRELYPPSRIWSALLTPQEFTYPNLRFKKRQRQFRIQKVLRSAAAGVTETAGTENRLSRRPGTTGYQVVPVSPVSPWWTRHGDGCLRAQNRTGKMKLTSQTCSTAPTHCKIEARKSTSRTGEKICRSRLKPSSKP